MNLNSPLFYIMIGIIISCLIPWFNFLLYKVYSGLKQMGTASKDSEEISEEAVSVIITAHNMAEHLKKNLPLILEQSYERFEVIVVNDSSTDNTEDVLKLLERKYNNLYHTFTPETAKYVSHKKLALTLGVRAAKYEWLVFTEANCVPATDSWLKTLSRNFTADTNIVIGYTNYIEDETCLWFSRKIIFDRLYMQMYQMHQAQCYRAVKATGCNLAYRKSFFIAHKGFSNHLDLLRGSNELFINNYADYKEGTRVEMSPESFVFQAVPEPHRLWQEDKVFYMETRRHYKHKFNAHALFNWNTFINYFSWIAYTVAVLYSLFVNPLSFIPYGEWILSGSLVLVFVGWQVLKICLFHKTTVYVSAPNYYLSLLWYELWIPIRNFCIWLKYCSMDRRNFMRR